MQRSVFILFLSILFTGLITGVCLGQSEELVVGNTFGIGARSMGMGGASLGLADDFTALYWNPAGIAQIGQFELFTSFSHNTAITDSSFTNEAVIGTSRSRVRPNSVGIVYPFYTEQGGLAIAFGYNRPQNFDFQTLIQGVDPSIGNDFSGLYVNESNINSGGIGIWSFGGSVYVSRNFLIGGSIDYWTGDIHNDLVATATDTLNADSQLSRFRFDDELERNFSGVGGRVGILATFEEIVNLGITLVAPTEITVDEFWRQYLTVLYDDGEESSDPANGAFSYHLERPFEIGTGIALKLFEKRLVLAGDVQLTDWRQTRYDPAPADDIDVNYFEENYTTTLQTRLGAEFLIPEVATYLRLGYFRDEIPFAESEIENERDFFTFGVGKIFEESVKFDIAYMWGNWQQYRNELTTTHNTHRFFVSGAYRF